VAREVYSPFAELPLQVLVFGEDAQGWCSGGFRPAEVQAAAREQDVEFKVGGGAE
jgi:hypothetical protein